MVQKQFDVIGLGICAVDYLCLLPTYPELDEKTELVAFSKQGGGPVPTALVTLARLGANVSYIGKVGDDTEGQFIIKQLKQERVDTTFTIIDKSVQTPEAFIWVDQQTGKKCIALNRTGTVDVQPEEISRNDVVAAKILHLDGREVATSIQAAEWAREEGCLVVLDAGSMRPLMERLLNLVNYPVVSERFIQQFWNSIDPRQAVCKLLDFGVEAAVVTCGNKGCYAAANNEVLHQPAFQVNVVDTTGAGDVFHGAFIYGLIQDWELKRILKFASAVAAIKCTKLGGRAGIPSLEEVENFLAGEEL
jgi:sulfofructose kinase